MRHEFYYCTDAGRITRIRIVAGGHNCGIQHYDGITVRIFTAVATAYRRCPAVISSAAVVISDVCFRYFC